MKPCSSSGAATAASLLIALLAMPPSPALAADTPQASAKSNYVAYLKLDHSWYGITSNRFWDFDAVTGLSVAEDTTATGCVRSNGHPPTISSGKLTIGTPGTTVTPASIVVLMTQPRIVLIETVDHDVYCAGRVAEPSVFVDGFD